jgi:3-phenylpropionate/cinnamic acid dioxygenase small subunit
VSAGDDGEGEDRAPRPLTRPDAEDLLYREARYLDRRQFDAWLALYEADARFWMPSWRDDCHPTEDPSRELSLIYYEARARLEERVSRLRSGRSPASVPPSRTLHSIGNVEIEEEATAESPVILSNFVVHVFNPKRRQSLAFFGSYRHELRWRGAWRIAAKKVLLLNDYLPAFVDINTV